MTPHDNEDRELRVPVTLEFGATHYCKYCNTWGSPSPDWFQCGNCGQVGFLMANPFPENMVPYVVFKPITTADTILEASKNSATGNKV